MTHFTAEILFARKARPNGCRGPWCGATTSGPPHRSKLGRERARERGLRWGKTACRVPKQVIRCGACPRPRIALRTAPTRACRFAAMKWVNIHALWYNVGSLVLFVNTRAGQNKCLQPLGKGSACPSFSSRVKTSIPKAFLNDSPVAPAGLFRQDASRFVRRQVNVDSRPSRPSS